MIRYRITHGALSPSLEVAAAGLPIVLLMPAVDNRRRPPRNEEPVNEGSTYE